MKIFFLVLAEAQINEMKNKMLYKILFLTWFCLSLIVYPFSIAHAEFAGSSGLEKSMISGYQKNHSFQSSIHTLKAMEQKKNQAYSVFMPSLDFEYRKGKSDTTFNNIDSSGSTETRRFTAAQPLFAGGRNISNFKSIKTTIEAQRETLLLEENQLMLNIAVNYMNIARDIELLKATTKNEKVLEEHWNIAKKRFEFGEVTITDVRQAEARFADARTNRIKSEGNLEVSKANYQNVTLMNPDSISFDIDQQLPVLPETLQSAINIALIYNPEIRVAYLKEEILKSDINVAKGDLLPSVNFVASRSDADGAISSPEEAESYEVVLSVPLFRGGRELSEIKEKKYELSSAMSDNDQIKQRITTTIIEYWNDLQTAKSTIISTEKSVEASSLVLKSIIKEQQFGTRSMTDVLDAEKDFFNAESNLVIAKYNLVVSTYNLLALMGKLNVNDLELNI